MSAYVPMSRIICVPVAVFQQVTATHGDPEVFAGGCPNRRAQVSGVSNVAKSPFTCRAIAEGKITLCEGCHAQYQHAKEAKDEGLSSEDFVYLAEDDGQAVETKTFKERAVEWAKNHPVLAIVAGVGITVGFIGVVASLSSYLSSSSSGSTGTQKMVTNSASTRNLTGIGNLTITRNSTGIGNLTITSNLASIEKTQISTISSIIALNATLVGTATPDVPTTEVTTKGEATTSETITKPPTQRLPTTTTPNVTTTVPTAKPTTVANITSLTNASTITPTIEFASTMRTTAAANQSILNVFQEHVYKSATEGAENDEFKLCDVLEYARLSTVAYTQAESSLPTGWLVDTELAHNLTRNLGKSYRHHFNGRITTNEGLTALILKRGDNEVCVAFGGTGSGDTGGLNPATSGLLNPIAAAKQWKENFHMLYNAERIPKNYEQAANLTQAIKKMTLKEVTTTGHSLGGSLCSFAAAMVGTPDNPMTANCFCSSPINPAMQSKIANKCHSPKDAQNLTSKIKHFTVIGDHVSKSHEYFNINNGLSLLGTAYEMSAQAADEKAGWFGSIFKAVTELTDVTNAARLHGMYESVYQGLARQRGEDCPSVNFIAKEPTKAPKGAESKGLFNFGGWFG